MTRPIELARLHGHPALLATLIGLTVCMQLGSAYLLKPAPEARPENILGIGPILSALKVDKLQAYLSPSGIDAERIRAVAERSKLDDSHARHFIVYSRAYAKRRTDEKIACMKYLLPARAKFTPILSI